MRQSNAPPATCARTIDAIPSALASARVLPITADAADVECEVAGEVTGSARTPGGDVRGIDGEHPYICGGLVEIKLVSADEFLELVPALRARVGAS